MNATELKIAAELKGMNVAELRDKFLEVFGEPSKGGADYLRKKIHYALTQAQKREEVTTEAEEELAQGNTAETLANGYAEQAIEAEGWGDWRLAQEQWSKAASASVQCKDTYQQRAKMADGEAKKLEAQRAERPPASAPVPRKGLFGSKREGKIKVTLDGKDITPPADPEPAKPVDLMTELRKSLKPKAADPVAPAGETPEQHQDRMTLQGAKRIAEDAERRGELQAAADAWGLVALIDSRNAEEYLHRARALRSLAREAPHDTRAVVDGPEGPFRFGHPPAEVAESDEPQPTDGTLAMSAVDFNELAKDVARAAAGVHKDRRIPAIGTLIKRVINEQRLIFQVVPDGFRVSADSQVLAGAHYKTLSGVARAAAGRNTNGYVFFGLDEELPPGQSAADGGVASGSAPSIEVEKPEACGEVGPEGEVCMKKPHQDGPHISQGGTVWVISGPVLKKMSEIAKELNARTAADAKCDAEGPQGERCELEPHGPEGAHGQKTNGSSHWMGESDGGVTIRSAETKLAIAGKLRELQRLVGEVAELLEHDVFGTDVAAPHAAKAGA